MELEVFGPYWVYSGGHPSGVIVDYAAPAEHAFRSTLQALVTVVQW